jgi:TolB-like protein
MSFLGEIKRRKIFQVAAVYAVVAWLLIQIVATVEAPLNLPDWVDTLVIVLLAVGFPITIIMSWGFNLTAEGFVREGGSDAAVATRPRRGIEFVLIGLIIVALFWLVYRVEFAEPETIAASPVPAESVSEEVAAEKPTDALPNSIAVLPFENLSPDPDNAYFAAGIHESTLNQLAKISGLIVLSRTSVMQYEEDRPSIPEIAAELNADTIMEGSVRYSNGRVLITAQLIDGRTDANLWSDQYNRELADVFAVQAEVAEQISIAMQVQLLPEERARIETRPTESAEAYQHYLHALSLPFGRDYWLAFRGSLENAIAADPGFADAYAELAWSHNVAGNVEQAVEYANVAIELDPTLGNAYQLLGDIASDYHARQREYRSYFERAVALSPNDPWILSYHCYRLADNVERLPEALPFCRRAVAIEPTTPEWHRRLGVVLMRAGDFDEAAVRIGEAIEIDPVTDHVRYLDLAMVEYLSGNSRAAIENLNRAVQIMSSREVFRVDYIAHLYGLLGDVATAEKLLARFQELYGSNERAAGRTLGFAYLGVRDKIRALDDWTQTVDGYLEKGWPVSPGRISRFRDNWLNDPILEEPEFLELRRRLGYEG